LSPEYTVHYNPELTISDHYPITYKLHIDSNQPTKFITSWNLNRGDWLQFKTNLDILYNDFQIKPGIDVDKVVDKFTTDIYNTAIDCLGFSEYNPRNKPWWNKKVNKQKKLIKKLRNKIHQMRQRQHKYDETHTLNDTEYFEFHNQLNLKQ